ncbi:MAG: hypothetical protein LW863_20835, partial [Flammeovirgaceae bacterium]|nr:hypothetical protein [Flammeovirgaceae bacterium]
DIVGIQPIGKVTLQITGDDLVFGVNGDYCKGKIKDGSISLLNACYAQSPSWVISERAEGTMYIYPRLGAMYYYDLVMKKVQK